MLVTIDPGVQGGICIWYSDTGFDVYPLKGTSDSEIVKILNNVPRRTLVIIEEAQATRLGVVPNFEKGVAFGYLVGVCKALGLEVDYVRPARWIKDLGMVKAKGDSDSVAHRKRRDTAIKLYPALLETMKKTISLEVADSVLIGHWFKTSFHQNGI